MVVLRSFYMIELARPLHRCRSLGVHLICPSGKSVPLFARAGRLSQSAIFVSRFNAVGPIRFPGAKILLPFFGKLVY